MPLTEQSQASEPPDEPAAEPALNPLDAIRLLRSAGGELVAQLILHGQLARVEWAEQKARLLQMFVITLLGFICVLCVMLFAGAMVVAFSWQTAYRLPVVAAVILVYLLGILFAWRRFQTLSAQSSQAFAATREELAADMALFRSKF